MISTIENIFGVVVMVSLIVVFSLAIILCLGWIIIMCVDALKERFKNKKE